MAVVTLEDSDEENEKTATIKEVAIESQTKSQTQSQLQAQMPSSAVKAMSVRRARSKAHSGK
jgi:hypothetical protein